MRYVIWDKTPWNRFQSCLTLQAGKRSVKFQRGDRPECWDSPSAASPIPLHEAPAAAGQSIVYSETRNRGLIVSLPQATGPSNASSILSQSLSRECATPLLSRGIRDERQDTRKKLLRGTLCSSLYEMKAISPRIQGVAVVDRRLFRPKKLGVRGRIQEK